MTGNRKKASTRETKIPYIRTVIYNFIAQSKSFPSFSLSLSVSVDPYLPEAIDRLPNDHFFRVIFPSFPPPSPSPFLLSSVEHGPSQPAIQGSRGRSFARLPRFRHAERDRKRERYIEEDVKKELETQVRRRRK